jgi:hypothetical protein
LEHSEILQIGWRKQSVIVRTCTERTIYKYVIKCDWTRRYRVTPRGEAGARAKHARGRRHEDTFAPVKGAGGRFIRREDAGKPFARGPKAIDPPGHERALAACAAAEPLSRGARAQDAARFEERLRAVAEVNRAAEQLRRYRERRAKQGETDRRRRTASA